MAWEEDASPVRRVWRYLDNRRDYLAYEKAIENGLPLGSGMIESGNKHVLQAWMKIPGASWNIETAENFFQDFSCPHIMVVTAEPTPSRISSLALGTGDIDCVYHFALNELRESIFESENDEALQSLDIMIEGKRLHDIADLPMDLFA